MFLGHGSHLVTFSQVLSAERRGVVPGQSIILLWVKNPPRGRDGVSLKGFLMFNGVLGFFFSHGQVVKAVKTVGQLRC